MINLTINENEDQQRLDRFLKKYLKNAPLSYIYKLIRKDVKLNGKRGTIETMLKTGDLLTLYISQEEVDKFVQTKEIKRAKKQFNVAYEDENILIAEKPFGLLVHGDSKEKKNHLANQVIDYLITNKEYYPSKEKTFVPSPVNRLDRNTTGLVLFGKNNQSLQALNKMIREENYIDKFYLTIVHGKLRKDLILKDRIEKDESKNLVKVLELGAEEGKIIETIGRPLMSTKDYTLIEIQLITGRTHQIRAHLAAAGYPIIGDAKYGDSRQNKKIEREFGLTTQFLHAYKLRINKGVGPLEYLEDFEVIGQLPNNLEVIAKTLFEDVGY